MAPQPNNSKRGKNNIMRRNKNIILNLRSIIPYFTGKEKIIALVSIIIMLSFANIINTSALSYSSSVGIGFTFNPTLSVSISPSDLIIPSLTPGTTADGNNITVSVATNAAYGYTLSVMMNGNNNDLTHTNGTNVFSSIATDGSLPSLTTDNTWGYSYKLSNDTNWNNYSGLSNETSKTLVDSNDQTAIPIDFKIGAKASGTQPSGTYTGTINFTAVTKPTPMNLAESYFAAGKTRHNGYYAMQDMTTEICNNTEVIGEGSQTQLIDLRDSKVYWATKLADGHCWMTQNLDLDLDSGKTYTHWDTDLGWSTENGNTIDENASWQPIAGVSSWQNSNAEPHYSNPGDIYYYTSNSDADDIQYNSLQECIKAGHNDCTHYHTGNYYNWNAAVANNDTSNMTTSGNAPNSICPRGWKIPNSFGILLYRQGVASSSSSRTYTNNGFYNIRKSPLYFVRTRAGNNGSLWTNYFYRQRYALKHFFDRTVTWPGYQDDRSVGASVRCLVR